MNGSNERGWIRMWRKLTDPDHDMAAGESACKRWAWMDLVSMASHEPTRRAIGYEVVELSRGELLASRRFLASRWGWSLGRTTRFLEWLEAGTRIGTVRGTANGTVYRIMKYDTYQDVRNTERNSQRNDDGYRSGTGAEQREELQELKEVENPSPAHEPAPAREAAELDQSENGSAAGGVADPEIEHTEREYFEAASTLLGLNRLPNDMLRQNERMIRSWLYGSNARPRESIWAALHGAALLRDQGGSWLELNTPYGVAVLQRAGALRDQGDGASVRTTLWQLSVEKYYQPPTESSTEPRTSRAAGQPVRISELLT